MLVSIKSVIGAVIVLVVMGCGGGNNPNTNVDGESGSNSKGTKPTIRLIGQDTVLVNVGGSYQENGAKASDDNDGDISSKINIEGSVDTNKEGRYIIRYSVRDSDGNEAVAKRIVEVFKDPSKDDWRNSNGKIEVKNEENITILSLESNDGKESGFVYTKYPFDTSNRYIKWIFKTKENFSLRIKVDTNDGERVLYYNQKDTGTGESSSATTHYIGHGLGSHLVNGEWHSVIRDVEHDLKRYDSALKLNQIKEIYFYGVNAQVAAIKVYANEKDNNIDKPVFVTSPGVVLTFDDSYVENWNEYMDYFKNEGVVATFFCHRWASSNNITETEAALLKTFENNGHEVGYHTKDHLGTKDEKYDDYSTKEAKAQAYFDDQIKPGVENMKERGFNPQSFSYPFISGQPAHNMIIRETLPHIREFFAHVYVMDTELTGGSKTLEEIEKFLDKLKKEKEIGVLLGHGIGDSDNITNYTPKDKLEKIIAYAKKIGLKFYTIKEAHNIYLNQ